MNNNTVREQSLRATLQRDRGAAIRQYRNALHLHGDPSQSENVSGEEMIQAIMKAEQSDSIAC